MDYTRSPDTTHSAAIHSVFNVTSITNEGGQADYPFFWTGTTHAASDGGGAFAVYIAFGRASGYMQTPSGGTQRQDVHGAGAQRSDPKSGNASDYPNGHGPQGDVVRINNFVRLVRDAAPGGVTPPATTTVAPTTTATATATSVSNQYNIRPPNGAIVQTKQPLLKWNTVQKTVRYEIQLRAKSTGGTMIANTKRTCSEIYLYCLLA